jgi:hypothetical protein
MSDDGTATDVWAERANDLYWASDMTVDEIVDDLGVSRTSLYAAIEPIPAGLVCTDCDERMVYTNRTARDRGLATCPACGRESEPGGEVGEGVREAGRVAGIRDWGEEVPARLDRWRVDLAAVAPERVAMVGGAAALGMVIGAVAARAVRGRS